MKKAKHRLSSFLGMPIDSATVFKPVYFLFINADGKDAGNAIFIDFNLIYKMNEEERVNFLAHEFFHNLREKYENHGFNYTCDMNYTLDMIQNEGVADMIDKAGGYEKYYSETMELPELAEIMVALYGQAPEDLGKLQNVIVKYSKDEITEKEMVDTIIELVKINGHPIGFFMANQITKAGYKNEMIETFYNPYKFYSLYNKAAKEQGGFRLSDEFMDYLKEITKGYYH